MNFFVVVALFWYELLGEDQNENVNCGRVPPLGANIVSFVLNLKFHTKTGGGATKIN